MIGFLFILLLALPVIELAVIIEVGGLIGWAETFGLLILMSIVGAWLLKREGTAAWRRFQAATARGDIPAKEATDGAMILVGGALLLTPGFISDIIGLLMILPPTRAALKTSARKVLGFFVLQRFGLAGDVGKRVYDARVTKMRRTTTPPDQLPSSEPPTAADGSRDTA
jgi:UPF0716 protein FxsA